MLLGIDGLPARQCSRLLCTLTCGLGKSPRVFSPLQCRPRLLGGLERGLARALRLVGERDAASVARRRVRSCVTLAKPISSS